MFYSPNVYSFWRLWVAWWMSSWAMEGQSFTTPPLFYFPPFPGSASVFLPSALPSGWGSRCAWCQLQWVLKVSAITQLTTQECSDWQLSQQWQMQENAKGGAFPPCSTILSFPHHQAWRKLVSVEGSQPSDVCTPPSELIEAGTVFCGEENGEKSLAGG